MSARSQRSQDDVIDERTETALRRLITRMGEDDGATTWYECQCCGEVIDPADVRPIYSGSTMSRYHQRPRAVGDGFVKCGPVLAVSD